MTATISRRALLRSLGASTAFLGVGRIAWGADSVPTLYYMDGYHGGARGHMPEGCWRDILESLDRFPNWKLSLDVEADSWKTLRQQDPSTFRRLAALLAAGRVEITGVTFSQPYGWAVSGESNIRQLERGLQLIRHSFPQVRLETYAVQEPCWASCLPQLLRSFGVTGASLKNASTAWGGYTQGFDAELVNWIGPDGSSIPAVPRYQQERLLHVWETEATEITPDYALRCVQHGIPQPAGMCFQDLGWAAQPRVSAPWVRFATWREYMHDVARSKPVDWHFSMEDILTALPWGEKTLHRASQQVREAEVRLVHAEKLASMACLASGFAWPSEQLEAAWDRCMWSQAHDAWITVTTRSGRQAWAFQVASETLDASDSAGHIVDEAVASLCRGGRAEADVRYIRAFNTLGSQRSSLIELPLAAGPDCKAFEVRDADGRVLVCQANVTRRYVTPSKDEGVHQPVMDTRPTSSGPLSINAATLLFHGQLPAFGWNTFAVRELQSPSPELASQGISAQVEADGSVLIESDLYRVYLDAARGGAISSLYAKHLEKEMCAEGKLLNAYRGFFSLENRWQASSDSPATLRLLEHGPVRVRVQVLGTVGGCPFLATTTVVQGQARIDCEVSFQFEQDTWIGDPWDIKPENRNKERRRSSNDGRPKLQAIFPASLSQTSLYKSSAFDVCRSRNESTHFQRWDEIRHNIITTWVDLYDEHQAIGLALFSDRTTAYSHGDGEPLGLILAWGGEAGFWWGKCPLRGEQTSSYSILPHQGAWHDARIWQENEALEETVPAQEIDAISFPQQHEASLLSISSPRVSISSVVVQEGALLVRLFCASPTAEPCSLELGFAAPKASLVELDGRFIEALTVHTASPGKHGLQLTMPPFSLRTVQIPLSPHLHGTRENSAPHATKGHLQNGDRR